MNKFKFLLSLLTLLSFNNVIAQQDGIELGPFTLFPSLGLSYGHDSNITYANDNSEKLSANFYTFAPGVRLETEGEKTNFLAQYDYNKTSYNGESKFDFEMHHLLASFGYSASRRSHLKVNAEYFDGTDRVGTGNQQGNIIGLGLDPDEWHSFGLSGLWHYGNVGAKGSIDLEAGIVDREYDNNREFTASRDRNTKYMGVTYAHEMSPKTNFLAQFKHAVLDYDTALLDSKETRLMFGAEWQATGKTSARALVGYLNKDFDEPQHDDFSGVAVEVGATWSPRSYSVFDLTLNREADETNGNGSYVIRNSADVGWTHFWKDRFSTTASVGVSNEDYQGDTLRDDDVNYYGVSAKYQFKDWLMSGLGYKHIDRSSSINEFEYDDNTLLFTLELSK